jgi:hypothetical protein
MINTGSSNDNDNDNQNNKDRREGGGVVSYGILAFDSMREMR